MRSQALLRRSRTVLKLRLYPRGLTQQSVLATRSLKGLHSTSVVRSRGSHARNLSSAAPPPSDPPTPPPEDSEKPKPRGRTKRSQEKAENAALPPDLHILWTPSDVHLSSPSALPPPDLFQEALNNLLITLHPQTQHRATYSSNNGSPVEPTLALYCPIEGGDYVIDETVRELARHTRSEVIVLDAIEIAAGEWGAFGKAATAIQLPENPLHFSSSSTMIPSSSSSSSSIQVEQDDEGPDEGSGPHIILSASQPFPFSQLGVPIARSSRSNFVVSKRTQPPKAKAFFDDIINMPSAGPVDANKEVPPSYPPPRIIYVRDYPTLAPSLSSWFHALVSSVRSHRQGAIPRPTSPISTPVTIVFGMTPSIVPPPSSPSPSAGNPTGLLRFLMNRGTAGVANRRSDAGRPTDPWDESEVAEKARERRLRERLRSWENGDPSFREELPDFSPSASEGSESSAPGTGLIIAGPGGQPFGSGIVATRQNESRNGNDDGSYFRLSVIVPKERSAVQEKECRLARRRQINELVMRMAVGSVGGAISERPALAETSEAEEIAVQEVVAATKSPLDVASATVESPKDGAPAPAEMKAEETTPDVCDPLDMLNDWGQRVEVWTTVKEIADRAVGSVVASLAATAPNEVIGNAVSLEPTPIPWSAIQSAWASQRNARHTRHAWIEESSGRTADDDDRVKSTEGAQQVEADEVIERVKRDPDLDQHETRLLGCIVDSSSMTTTFDQVHLPEHTIDSVRTLVSLPLLHPQAFAQGILKQHTMTGALLFGPPGTGKTLVVRALARDSGARMLIIKPSDVMDMYVGEGEKLVRSVFSLARRLSPCVVFLDELDALFGARVSARETGGAIAHRGVITEFMQEMDGLKTSRDSNVIVIGATNRPFDLDDAVLRRLPRRLLVDLPGEKEREEILKILLRDEALAPEVDLKHLAKRTESFSGSDLKHLCVSAALDAVKERVRLPWNVPRSTPLATHDNVLQAEFSATSSASPSVVDVASPPPGAGASVPPPSQTPFSRILSRHNFTKALSEITPSASESLGTLSDLRKWNEEFGEGGKKRKKRMWGGRFGFSDKMPETGEGKVGSIIPPR